MKNFEELKHAVNNNIPLVWNDPYAIEGNDYTITFIEPLDEIDDHEDPNKTFGASKNPSLSISQNDFTNRKADKKTRTADLEVQRVQDKVSNDSSMVV